MSMIYDNWERLVAAVLKREEIWQLCHEHSRSPSICSESSDSSSSFLLSDVKLQKKEESVQETVPKLVFLGGSTHGFPLKGALKGAQELGKGTFGTSILTQLLQDVEVSDQELLATGTELVMKLLNEVKATEEEFKQQMMVFGNCRHENVAAPRAYYFSNKANRKLLFYNYHSQGSVSDMLHGNRSKPNWESRLRIAIGAARGIAHIHTQCGGKLAHGNMKSSNIFLNSQQYGCVSDFSLAGIMEKKPVLRGLEYHAAAHFRSESQELDVYNFGSLLLELLTGKSPMQAQGLEKDLELVTWVRSLEPHQWTSKLFDRSLMDENNLIEMVKTETPGVDLVTKDSVTDLEASTSIPSSHFHSIDRVPTFYFRAQDLLEMVEVLHVAMRCLALFPEDRPKMSDVVLMLENIASLSDGKPQQAQNNYHTDEKQRAMLWFTYTGTLPEEEEEAVADSGELMLKYSFMAKMLAAADQFDLQRLKEICESRIVEKVLVGYLLHLADLYHATKLKAACLRFAAENQAVVLKSDGSEYLGETCPLLFQEFAGFKENRFTRGEGVLGFCSKIISGVNKSFVSTFGPLKHKIKEV